MCRTRWRASRWGTSAAISSAVVIRRGSKAGPMLTDCQPSRGEPKIRRRPPGRGDPGRPPPPAPIALEEQVERSAAGALLEGADPRLQVADPGIREAAHQGVPALEVLRPGLTNPHAGGRRGHG